MRCHPIAAVGKEVIYRVQSGDIFCLNTDLGTVRRDRQPTIGTGEGDRRAGSDLHQTVHSLLIAIGGTTIDMEMTGEHQVYTVRHQAVTQCVCILETTSTLQRSLLVKMLQDLPVSHRDDGMSFGTSDIRLIQHPSQGSIGQHTRSGIAVRTVDTDDGDALQRRNGIRTRVRFFKGILKRTRIERLPVGTRQIVVSRNNKGPDTGLLQTVQRRRNGIMRCLFAVTGQVTRNKHQRRMMH